MFIFDHSLQITQPNLTPMLSFRVFASIESRPTHSHLVGKIPTRSGHPRRFVSPPPRDLCGRLLPRPCRGVGVHPEKIIRVGLVDRRTCTFTHWPELATQPERFHPSSIIPYAFSHWPELANRPERLFPRFPSTFNRRSRPCRDCRLSTSSAPLPRFHTSLPTPALSPLSATLTQNTGGGVELLEHVSAAPMQMQTEEREGAKRKGGPKSALTEREAWQT